MNFGSCCLFLLSCLAVDMMWCTWDCTSFHKRLVCVLAWCMGASTMTMFTPGPQTHHELRLRWLMQAQRTGSGGNWMGSIMNFKPQTPQRWAWTSWGIVLTKLREFVPQPIKITCLQGRFWGSLGALNKLPQSHVMDLGLQAMSELAWCFL